MPLFKRNVGLLTALRKPVSFEALQPLCMTCGRYLDSWNMVEQQGTRVRMLGKHHGAEEAVWFDMGTRQWEAEDLAAVMRAHDWFPPNEVSAPALVNKR